MKTSNPFTPTFGLTPAVPVGQDEVVEAFNDGLKAGPGAPARALFLVAVSSKSETAFLLAHYPCDIDMCLTLLKKERYI